MMMKRGRVNKQGESVVASYRYLGVSYLGLIGLGAMSVMYPVYKAPIYQKNSCTLLFPGLSAALR